MSDAVVPLPRGFGRKAEGDRVILSWSWRTDRSLIIIFLFTLVWDGFLFLWYGAALAAPTRDWSMILFPLLHVAFGIFLTYYCVSALCNTTTVEVSADLLRVATGPVPWHREIRLVPVEISDVIYHENANPGYSSTYKLIAVLGPDREKILLSLAQYEHVVFYVRELRALLGLPDRPLSRDA